MQIAERHAGAIRRLNASKRRARSVCEKIPHQLRRRAIILPAGFKRRTLELLLIPYAAERSLVREILGGQRDEKRSVRVLAVSRAVAHAVCNNAPFFGCRCDHIAARAHAERVRACSVRELDVQLIVRRAERRVLRKRTVLAVANHALWVLDANAHRKCLRLHGNARFFQHPERISRAVAQRQDEIAAGNLLLAVRCFIDRARDAATL